MFASLILAASLLAAPVPKQTRLECDAVLKILTERVLEPELRREAIEQLGLLRYRKAATVIRYYLRDPSIAIRIQAVAALIACDGVDEICVAEVAKIRKAVLETKTLETTAELDPIFLACSQYPDEAKTLSEFIFATIRDRRHYSGASGLYEAYLPLAGRSGAEIEALLILCQKLTWPCQDQNDYRLVVALSDILANLPKWPAGGKAELERWLSVEQFGLEIVCSHTLLTKEPGHAKAVAAIRKCTLRTSEEKRLSLLLPWCHSATRKDAKLYSDIGRLAFPENSGDYATDYFWKCLGAQGSRAKQFLPDFEKRSRSKVAVERYAAITAMIQIEPGLYDKYLPAIINGVESTDEIDSLPAAQALISIARPEAKLIARMLVELKRRSVERHSTERIAFFIEKTDSENAEMAQWIRKRLKSWPEENATPKLRQWNRLPEMLGDFGPKAKLFAPDLLKLVPDSKGVLPDAAVVRAIGNVTQPQK